MVAVKQRSIQIEIIKVSSDIHLECQLEGKHPIVICNQKKYTNLRTLHKDVPELIDAIDLKDLAHLLNFMSSGREYQVLDKVKRYKDEYLARIEFEKNSFDYLPVRLSEHGIFDVSVMHAPRVVGEEFAFFVKNIESQIPYRVSCLYPIDLEKPDLRYQLLAYASSLS